MAATKTVLEIVQKILNEMDGDEVNSISDTTEAEQVANIVSSVYTNMMSNSNWPHTRRAVAVTTSSDTNYPTHMVLNDDVKELISIRYNIIKNGETRKNYSKMEYLDPDKFLTKINARDSDASNVQIVTDYSGIELLILNDTAPTYFTSFDDTNIVFDAYDSDVENTLQQSKIQAMGYIIPDFQVEDSFVPDLPPDAFAFLIEESTSRSQLKLREFQDVKSESEAIRQGNWLSRKSWRTSGGTKYPDYGMKR